jgi:hypothetical protein
MNLDDIIRNSYEQEHINLNQLPNKQQETLDYILSYSENKAKNPFVKLKERFSNFASNLQIMDAIGMLIFIIILFAIPSLIRQSKQPADANLVKNPPHQTNTQQPVNSDPTKGQETKKINETPPHKSYMDFLVLSPELSEIYNKYSKDKKDEVLRGLAPQDVCRLYFYAQSKNDYNTLYSLYLQDEVYVIPTKEEFLRDIDNKVNVENTAKLIKVLKEKVTDVQLEYGEGNALVKIYIDDREFWDNDYIWFNLLKTKTGIWKVQFMPMQ